MALVLAIGMAGAACDESTARQPGADAALHGGKSDKGSTPANPESVVRGFIEAFDRGDVDEAFSLVSEDVVWWVPGDLPFSGTLTKPEYLGIVNRIQQGFPEGLSMRITGVTAEGDRVAVEAVSEGAHVSGRAYNNHYHFLFVVRGGLIVEAREHMDTKHLADLLAPPS